MQKSQTIPLWPDAAVALGIGKNTVYELAKAGKLPALRLGRKWRVPLVALEDFLRCRVRKDAA